MIGVKRQPCIHCSDFMSNLRERNYFRIVEKIAPVSEAIVLTDWGVSRKRIIGIRTHYMCFKLSSRYFKQVGGTVGIFDFGGLKREGSLLGCSPKSKNSRRTA